MKRLFALCFLLNGCAHQSSFTLFDRVPPPIPQIYPVSDNKQEAKRLPASVGVTPCTNQTASSGTPIEKAWRDALSWEVINRICDTDPIIAKKWRTDTEYDPKSWAYDLDLTGVTLNVPRGTAITSRHVLYTKHAGYHGKVGDTLRFLTRDNRQVTRKVVGVKYITGSRGEPVDLALIRLDSALPSGISPLSVLDQNFSLIIPQYTPLLRLDQENKALIVEVGWNGGVGATKSLPPENPAGPAFTRFYEDMVTGDSSSPSILLLKNQWGVIPILYSLVTYGGPGHGPLVHVYASQIERAIQDFGDGNGMSFVRSLDGQGNVPFCSIVASRGKSPDTCFLDVRGSAEPIEGDPQIIPETEVNWRRTRNQWEGSIPCTSDPEQVFQAQLSGSTGRGPWCESGSVGPVVSQCELMINRQEGSARCDVQVKWLVGDSAIEPFLSPSNPQDWHQRGEYWNGTVDCSQDEEIDFSVQTANGSRKICSHHLSKVFKNPSCSIAAKRQGYTAKCEVIISKTEGDALGFPKLKPNPISFWIKEGDRYTTTAVCPVNQPARFAGRLLGVSGNSKLCVSPIVRPVSRKVPFCRIQAARVGLSDQCVLKTYLTRGRAISRPIVDGLGPESWKKISRFWRAIIACDRDSSHNFTAVFNGPLGLGRPCLSNQIKPIPAPKCELNVKHVGQTDQCEFKLTGTSPLGTIGSYRFSHLRKVTDWDGKNEVTGNVSCNPSIDTTFSATVFAAQGYQVGKCEDLVRRL